MPLMAAATTPVNADAEHERRRVVAQLELATLATTEAAQAPMRNLPSMAMLGMPERSDMMPANAPSEIGAASASVPGEHAGHVGGLAVEQGREGRDDPQRDDEREHRGATGTTRRGRAAACRTRR